MTTSEFREADPTPGEGRGMVVHWSAYLPAPEAAPRVRFDGHEVRCVETISVDPDPDYPEITPGGVRRPERAPRQVTTVTMRVPIASLTYDGREVSVFTGPDPQRVLDVLQECVEHLGAYAPAHPAVLQARAQARRLLEQAGRA